MYYVHCRGIVPETNVQNIIVTRASHEIQLFSQMRKMPKQNPITKNARSTNVYTNI